MKIDLYNKEGLVTLLPYFLWSSFVYKRTKSIQIKFIVSNPINVTQFEGDK